MPCPAAMHSPDLLFLRRRQIQAFIKERPAEHRRGAFPLQIDLLEAAELLGGEILVEPLTHFFIDLPARRNAPASFRPFRREPCAGMQLPRAGIDDLLGSELEVGF